MALLGCQGFRVSTSMIGRILIYLKARGEVLKEPPHSPKLNGQVERAHRTHIEEFCEVYEGEWSQHSLNPALLLWERGYNTIRPHQTLKSLTPSGYLNNATRNWPLCLICSGRAHKVAFSEHQC